MDILKEISDATELMEKAEQVLKKVQANMMEMMVNDEKEMNKMAQYYGEDNATKIS